MLCYTSWGGGKMPEYMRVSIVVDSAGLIGLFFCAFCIDCNMLYIA